MTKLQLAAIEVLMWVLYWGFVGIFWAVTILLIGYPQNTANALKLVFVDLSVVLATFLVTGAVTLVEYIRSTSL